MTERQFPQPDNESVSPSEFTNEFVKRFEYNPFEEFVSSLEIPDDEVRLYVLPNRQFAPIEDSLMYLGHVQSVPESDLGLQREQFRVFSDRKRGRIGNTDVSVGIVNLHVKKSEDDSSQKAFLVQYARNPQESFGNDEYGNPKRETFNDGIVNVLMTPSGEIYTTMMLPNGEYRLDSFVPPYGKKVGQSYPKDEIDALNSFKKSGVSPRFFPLLQKAAMLTTAVSDTYLKRDRDYKESERSFLLTDSEISTYNFSKNGISPELAEVVGLDDLEHPLKNLVHEDLIPEQSHVYLTDSLEEMVKTLAHGGYPMPVMFRSYKHGVYVSENAPWNVDQAALGFQELLAYNSDISLQKGSILTKTKLPEHTNSWESIYSLLQHNLILQAYEETLSEQAKAEFMAFCDENVSQIKHLGNHTYLTTEIPENDQKSPYKFNHYSERSKNKYLAGFLAGMMTMPKELFRYWADPPLWGDGTERWHWTPKGMKELMAKHGFNVDQIQQSKIHPPFVRHITKDGTIEMADRPFANPSQVL